MTEYLAKHKCLILNYIVKSDLLFNPIVKRGPSKPPTFQPHTFRSVNLHKADYEGINNDLSTVNWHELMSLCTDDDDGSEFTELFKLIILQICLLHSPPKVTTQSKSRYGRDRYVLNRKKRKMRSRLHCLRK